MATKQACQNPLGEQEDFDVNPRESQKQEHSSKKSQKCKVISKKRKFNSIDSNVSTSDVTNDGDDEAKVAVEKKDLNNEKSILNNNNNNNNNDKIEELDGNEPPKKRRRLEKQRKDRKDRKDSKQTERIEEIESSTANGNVTNINNNNSANDVMFDSNDSNNNNNNKSSDGSRNATESNEELNGMEMLQEGDYRIGTVNMNVRIIGTSINITIEGKVRGHIVKNGKFLTVGTRRFLLPEHKKYSCKMDGMQMSFG